MRGFSLVELSIVLVILGLLTGGILAGQSLIRAAELRSVTTEYQRYLTATQTFRDKYFALPGDFRDATRFWTRQVNAATCVTNASAAVSTPGTCDGDGNGVIDSMTAAVSVSGEWFQFWRQLALAGLIEGSYSGLAGPDTAIPGIDTIPGTNAPAGRIATSGWTARTYSGNGSTVLFRVAGGYGNGFVFGGRLASNMTAGQILKPEEAWNLDTKMDDGRPGTGKLLAVYWDDCTSATAFDEYASTYLLNDTTPRCSLWWINQF